MRHRLALIPTLLLLAALALPASAAAADQGRSIASTEAQLRAVRIIDVLRMGLGLEPHEPSPPTSTPGTGEDEGDADSDGLTNGDDSDASGAAGGVTNDASSNGYAGNANDTDGSTGDLGSGTEGGAADPNAESCNSLMNNVVVWAIGIIFGQDRPWEDSKAKRRG